MLTRKPILIHCSVILSLIFNNFASSQINLSNTACGPVQRSGRIVGGSEAIQGEFPFLVSITRRGGHFCGGAVLNGRYVITAGHCLCSGNNNILKPDQIKLTLSQHDLSNSTEVEKYEVVIDKILVHPDYKCTKSNDDLALLQLKKEIQWTDYVSPICLPEFQTKDVNDFSGFEATVAGWGWLNESTEKGGRANALQKTNVQVVDNTLCTEWYKSQGKKNKIQSGQMCAGHEQGGRDACWADSGGPLFVNMRGVYTLLGVVSTGVGCARPRLPGIYTRVTHYMDWIQKHTQY